MIKSLRSRIQIWNALILAVVIGVFGGSLYLQQRNSVLRSVDNEIRAAVAVLAGKLQAASPRTMQRYLFEGLRGDLHSPQFSERRMGPPPDDIPAFGPPGDGAPPAGFPRSEPGGRGQPGGLHRLVAKLDRDLYLPNTFHPNRMNGVVEGPYFLIWLGDGQEVKKSTDLEVPFPEFTRPENARPGDRRLQEITFRQRDSYREAWAPGAPGTLVLVGRNIKQDMQGLSVTGWWIGGSGAIAWLLGLGGGWLLSRGSTKPIEAISKVASDISERNLAGRIDTATMDVEFAGLSKTLNSSFARLQTAFERQRQFTADASHELRTPLSVLQTHQQLALSKPRTEKEYRETLQTCERAVERMNSLVDSLLMLARVDSDDAAAGFSSVDFHGLVQDEIDKLQLVAARKNLSICSDLHTATICGDENQLGRVICNLLTNAIQYSEPEGTIQIVLTNSGDQMKLEVTDFGEGIPEQDQARIFDRFYRVNKERSRETGGSGLGLAICKCIVERHGGTITVESTEGSGSTFRVTLPTVEST